jgi:NitT/TauT family transport system substrate-binding protein
MREFFKVSCVGLVLMAMTVAPAFSATKIRFTLDWIAGATHGAFLIAKQKGYYKAEGLDVSIVSGKGSGQVVNQIASGVYDMGFPDINVLMEFDSKNPDQAFPAVMNGYDESPSAVFVLKSSGITTPKQLDGKTIGSVVNDSTFKLFPAFAEKTGIDLSSIKVKYVDPRLREALLAQGRVDAIPGQVFNSLLELKAKGVPQDKVRYFMYKDYGLRLYSNTVAASRKFMKEHPDAVRGFIRATIKGMRDLIKNPEDGVKAALKFEPLLNPEIERERLKLALSCCIATKNVLQNGFGGFDKERLSKSIDIISATYKLPRKPSLDEIFDPSFLPPRKDRMVK